MTLSPTRVMSPPRNSSAAAQLRRDMESQVEAANKRAQKAKLAAQAALEEL